MTNPVTTIRQRDNLTRMRLSQKTGVPYATLTAMELGLVGEISQRTAESLSRVADQPAQNLMRDYSAWKQQLTQEAA